MGLLDDAIREHLELKRQHGANPDEVARQEREALGPARGGEAPAEPAEPEPVDEPDAPEDVAAVAAGDELPAGEPGVPEEPSPGHEAGAPGYDEDPWLEEEPSAPPAPAEDAGSEDVLEETPEFLQETPEHDRLWFEQKPPRDFDWDG
ncbi:MAG TPA: hypothetical protein VH418_03650 [Solirubrobacteraceae bacterium]|jgi:hypothetical protein